MKRKDDSTGIADLSGGRKVSRERQDDDYGKDRHSQAYAPGEAGNLRGCGMCRFFFTLRHGDHPHLSNLGVFHTYPFDRRRKLPTARQARTQTGSVLVERLPSNLSSEQGRSGREPEYRPGTSPSDSSRDATAFSLETLACCCTKSMSSSENVSFSCRHLFHIPHHLEDAISLGVHLRDRGARDMYLLGGRLYDYLPSSLGSPSC